MVMPATIPPSALFAALAAALTVAPRAAAQQPAPSPAFREPPSVSSRGGVLQVTLTATRSAISIGGEQAVTEVYDGSYIPRTLRVRPGDLIRLRLVNRLDEPTNLHMHGLHVSPGGISDNVFLSVPPGQTQDFEFHIPPTH